MSENRSHTEFDRSDAIRQSSPVFIGAVGGSGTRAVARVVKGAGYFLGTNLNRMEDAMEFFEFHERWIDQFLAAAAGGEPLSSTQMLAMTEEFERSTAMHLGPTPGASAAGRWGWKAPRGIFLLPFLHAHFPAMKFIHVLRDGRDMAFAANLGQLEKHGRHVLTWRERWSNRRALQAILFWARVNLRAAEYAEKYLGGNYLVVRLEDLCDQPVEGTVRILEFLGVSADAEAIARAEISRPPSIGRYRAQPGSVVATLEGAGAAGLQKFGYADESLVKSEERNAARPATDQAWILVAGLIDPIMSQAWETLL